MRQTDVLSTALSEALRVLEGWVDGFESGVSLDPVMYPLFHYSDSPAIDGIIRNEELWLTSIFQLNDPSEFTYGGDIVVREIQKQAATGRRVSLEKKIIDFFCDRMVEAFRGSIRDQFDIFVGSLSSNADDLYQWRSYGDDGRGFILGFSAEAIGAASVYISPVSYGPEKATRVYETIAKKAVDIIVGNMDHIRADREGGYNFLRLLSVELSKPILTQSVCTKHPAYEREREVRLLVVKQSGDTSGVERRPHRNGADQLRFVRVKIPVRRSGSITGIVVGPDAHPDTEAALRQYLCHLGVGSEGIVTRSKVPYRSMQPRTPLYSCFMTP